MFLLRVLFLASKVRIPDIMDEKKHTIVTCLFAFSPADTLKLRIQLLISISPSLVLTSLGNPYTKVSKLTAGTIMSFSRPSINGSNSGLKTTELHTNVCLFFRPFPDSLHRPIQERKLLLHVSTLGRDVLLIYSLLMEQISRELFYPNPQ